MSGIERNAESARPRQDNGPQRGGGASRGLPTAGKWTRHDERAAQSWLPSTAYRSDSLLYLPANPVPMRLGLHFSPAEEPLSLCQGFYEHSLFLSMMKVRFSENFSSHALLFG
jgi:hypothetical protein